VIGCLLKKISLASVIVTVVNLSRPAVRRWRRWGDGPARLTLHHRERHHDERREQEEHDVDQRNDLDPARLCPLGRNVEALMTGWKALLSRRVEREAASSISCRACSSCC